MKSRLSVCHGSKGPKARQHLEFDLLGFLGWRLTLVRSVKCNVERFPSEVVEELVGILDATASGTITVKGVVTLLNGGRRTLLTCRRIYAQPIKIERRARQQKVNPAVRALIAQSNPASRNGCLIHPSLSSVFFLTPPALRPAHALVERRPRERKDHGASKRIPPPPRSGS